MVMHGVMRDNFVFDVFSITLYVFMLRLPYSSHQHSVCIHMQWSRTRKQIRDTGTMEPWDELWLL